MTPSDFDDSIRALHNSPLVHGKSISVYTRIRALIQVRLGSKVDSKYFYRSLCILMTEMSQDYLQNSSFHLGLFIFQESPVFHTSALRFRLTCAQNGTHLKLVMRLGNLIICVIIL